MVTSSTPLDLSERLRLTALLSASERSTALPTAGLPTAVACASTAALLPLGSLVDCRRGH